MEQYEYIEEIDEDIEEIVEVEDDIEDIIEVDEADDIEEIIEVEDDIEYIEEVYKYNDKHDEKGRFATKDGNGLTGGGGSGSLQSSSNEVSATGANKFAKGFSKKNLIRHMNKHGKKDYPNLDENGYNNYAMELVQSKTTKEILGYKTADGAVVRYKTSSNDFVKGYPKDGIATMYKPKGNPQKGYEYFKRQMEKEGINHD